jgi:hypothetical protein
MRRLRLPDFAIGTSGVALAAAPEKSAGCAEKWWRYLAIY